VVGEAEKLPAEHPAWLRFEAWVESRRQDRSHLLLVSDGRDNSWAEAACDHADTVLLLANSDADPAPTGLELAMRQRNADTHAPPVWLALEHPADRELPSGTLAWLEPRNLEHHAHFRRGNERDVARLGRWLMGQARGIALSGGGARGFVHLGIAAELRRSGVEVDLIAGTSAGAMAGGLLGRDGDPETMMEGALKAIEAKGNPFVEFDLPIIALLRNRRLREGLHATYGEAAIEDCWIPLRIVATDLTESRRVVFDRGPVWQRVFAASSPPGVMPPVKDGDQLLCDGGLVDNLPVSVLMEAPCRVKMASYVGSAPVLPAPNSEFPTSWSLLFDKLIRRGRHKDVPTLITTLLQVASVPAAAQLESARKAADLFFHPDLSEFSVTDVGAARAMFQTGEAHAREVLARQKSREHDA
jgi:NTE family protein